MVEQGSDGVMEKHKRSKVELFLRLYQYSSTPTLHYSKKIVSAMSATCLERSPL